MRSQCLLALGLGLALTGKAVAVDAATGLVFKVHRAQALVSTSHRLGGQPILQ